MSDMYNLRSLDPVRQVLTAQNQLEISENRNKKQHGPSNVFETFYYNPSIPGSFGGIDALHRSLKSSGDKKSKQEIRNWFETQPSYTLHKPSRKRFKRNVILVHGVDEQFQADLADMSMLARYNNGVTFLLICIDVLSKYLWIVPLKNKAAHTVLAAFQLIFAERKPEKLQTDQGTEFTNSMVRDYMSQNGIKQFFAWNPDIKASIAERVTRTMKQKIWRYMTHMKTNRYIDVLPQLVHSYNNSYHRSIKMTPTEASLPQNTKHVWHNLYHGTSVMKANTNKNFKYKVGDYVRISEERDVFKKGYKQQWSTEVFQVIKQSPRDPVVYKLQDLSGEPLIGSFYEIELQRVSKPEAKEIERYLQTKTKDPRDFEFYVKHRGYPAYSYSVK